MVRSTPVYFWDPKPSSADTGYPIRAIGVLRDPASHLDRELDAWRPSDWIIGATAADGQREPRRPDDFGDPRRDVRREPEYERARVGLPVLARLPAPLVARRADHWRGHPEPVEIEIEGQSQVTSSDNSFASTWRISHHHVRPERPARTPSQAARRSSVTINPSTEAVTPAPAAGQPRVLNSPKNAGVSLPPSTARRRRRRWSASTATATRCGSGVRAARRRPTSSRSRGCRAAP